MIKIHTLGIDHKALPRQLTRNILVSDELSQKFPSLFNEKSMSTLDNYARHEKARIYFSLIKNDMFDNTKMSVFPSEGFSDSKASFSLNLSTNTRENFANSLREIYNKAAEAVKKFSQQ